MTDGPVGWECPRCHKCYAPQQLSCWNCQPKLYEPLYFVTPDDLNMTPNQVRDLQDALMAVAQSLDLSHKIIVLPPKAKIVSEKNI